MADSTCDIRRYYFVWEERIIKKQLALLQKELVLQKKQIGALFGLILAILGALPISKSASFDLNIQVVLATFIISSGIVTNSMVFDDKNNVAMFLVGLPIRRWEIVINKYLLALISSFFVSLVLNLVIGVFHHLHWFSPVFASDIPFSILVIVLYFCFVLPLYFWLGYAKTQLYAVLVIMTLIGLPLLFFHTQLSSISVDSQTTVNAPVNGAMFGVSLFALLVMLIPFFLSYLLSVWIYRHREVQ